MKTKTITLHFYSDPGHGWLKVPLKLLEDLQIADQISPYSYVKGSHAYLEEDCDCQRFSEVLKKAGIEFKVTPHSCNNRSAIRSYQNYTEQNIANLRKVPRVGMVVAYGGEIYTLLQPMLAGSWRIANRYGATYRITASKLACAMEVTA